MDTETQAERARRNFLARQALRTYRQQVLDAQKERETATGDELKACELELECYRTLIYDLERELGAALYEKDTRPCFDSGEAETDDPSVVA